MVRKVMAIAAGLAVWFFVLLIASPIIRALWPDYVRVAAEMNFTLAMKLLRLAVGAVATVAAGWTTAVVARSSAIAIATGAALLVIFIPEHISLWNKFPLWYHLTFLLSLVPLCVLGSRLLRRAPA
jgi:hypothetical protein